MNFIAILTLIISSYVFFESIAFAAEANRGAKLCIAARYVFCALAGLLAVHQSIDHIIIAYFADFVTPEKLKTSSPLNLETFVYVSALGLSCWSRMIYRLFGERRANLGV